MKKGFSLIELLVVIGIIASIVGFAAVSYSTVNRKARDTKRKGDMEQIRSALEIYRTDIGYYPNLGGGSYVDASGLSTSLVPSYIPAIPGDPQLGQAYRYKATNRSGNSYYGYCLSAKLEGADASGSCTPDTAISHNFGAKNP